MTSRVDAQSIDIVTARLASAATSLRIASDDEYLKDALRHAAATICKALITGGKVVFVGNGGSAADAQHMAAELVSRFLYDRHPIAAIALTTDTSILTALANDYGYRHVFSRQLEAVGHAGDVLVAYSTSGRSENILDALDTAKRLGIATIGLTGAAPNVMVEKCDICVQAPASSTAEIQELHFVFGHIFCHIIEATLCPRKQ